MDDAKAALSSRGMTVKVARNIGRSGEPCCICGWLNFKRLFLLGPAFFRTAVTRSHLERGRVN